MNRKLKLEAIEVESFPTTPGPRVPGIGTIHGHETGDGMVTCGVTQCADTCGICSIETYSQDTRPECDGWSDSDYTACMACTTYGYPGGGDFCNPTDAGTCLNYCTV